jgi:tRNA threonylcarbamoyladenosine biosynthesis protein TsaE
MATTFSQTFGIEELPQIAALLLKQKTSHIILLNGPMGAGKTTLVKELIQALGAVDAGSSPTFGLLNEYASKSGEVMAYHLDAYRLTDEEEAYDLGLEEFWAQNTPFIIEWPDKLGSLLPSDAFFVFLDYAEGGKRQIRW